MTDPIARLRGLPGRLRDASSAVYLEMRKSHFAAQGRPDRPCGDQTHCGIVSGPMWDAIYDLEDALPALLDVAEALKEIVGYDSLSDEPGEAGWAMREIASNALKRLAERGGGE